MDRTAKSRRSWKFAGRTRPPPPAATRPNSHSNTPNRVACPPSFTLALGATPTPRKLPAFHACVYVKILKLEEDPSSWRQEKKKKKRENKEKEVEGKKERFEDSISSLSFHLAHATFARIKISRRRRDDMIFLSREKLVGRPAREKSYGVR